MRKNEEIQFRELLGGVYKKLKIDDKVLVHRVEAVWNELFGSTFAKYLTKLDYSNKTLFLSISSDVLRHELFLNRSKIKERMNQELKENLIEKVILR